MDTMLPCQCGRQVKVNSASAGMEIPCECGARMRVPRLSEFRQMAGLGAYESGTIDNIRRMIAERALPWGESCAFSDQLTRDTLDLSVHCERVHGENDGMRLRIVVGLLFGPLWMMTARQGTREAVGRETAVWTPLRVAQEHQKKVTRASQKTLRRLLRTVPIYAKLLDQYPHSTIRVGKIETAGDRMMIESKP
jgi:hypothetical protein